jgi:hypothetical protein
VPRNKVSKLSGIAAAIIADFGHLQATRKYYSSRVRHGQAEGTSLALDGRACWQCRVNDLNGRSRSWSPIPTVANVVELRVQRRCFQARQLNSSGIGRQLTRDLKGGTRREKLFQDTWVKWAVASTAVTRPVLRTCCGIPRFLFEEPNSNR